MAQLGRLRLRVSKYLDGGSIWMGVPVRIRPIRKTSSKIENQRRTDRRKKIIDVVVPISASDRNYRDVPLKAGDYDIEAVLPSGELLLAEAKIKKGKTVNIVLRGEPSPNEWRSWAHYAGSRPASAERARLEGLGGVDGSTSLRTETTISLGTKGSYHRTAFNPLSWEAWFKLLQQRFERKAQPTQPIIGGPSTSVKMEIYGGSNGLPLRVTLFAPSTSFRDRTKVGKERLFVSIAKSKGSRIFSIPWPWDRRTPPRQPFFEILVSEIEGRQICDPVMRDEKLGGVLAYLNSGRVQFAEKLLRNSYGALFAKFENPLGAAAGGYILMSTQNGTRLKHWPEWIDNLTRYFPYIPDGPIMRGRWLLQQGDKDSLEKAALLFLEAVHRGIPFFTTGVVWLIEGLRRTSTYNEECAEQLPIVRGVARSIDLGQAFTSFDLPDPTTPTTRTAQRTKSLPGRIATRKRTQRKVQ